MTDSITVDRWIRARPITGRDGVELLNAFAHCERLRGAPLRKLSAAEWMNEFNVWRAAPRG